MQFKALGKAFDMRHNSQGLWTAVVLSKGLFTLVLLSQSTLEQMAAQSRRFKQYPWFISWSLMLDRPNLGGCLYGLDDSSHCGSTSVLMGPALSGSRRQCGSTGDQPLSLWQTAVQPCMMHAAVHSAIPVEAALPQFWAQSRVATVAYALKEGGAMTQQSDCYS